MEISSILSTSTTYTPTSTADYHDPSHHISTRASQTSVTRSISPNISDHHDIVRDRTASTGGGVTDLGLEETAGDSASTRGRQDADAAQVRPATTTSTSSTPILSTTSLPSMAEAAAAAAAAATTGTATSSSPARDIPVNPLLLTTNNNNNNNIEPIPLDPSLFSTDSTTNNNTNNENAIPPSERIATQIEQQQQPSSPAISSHGQIGTSNSITAEMIEQSLTPFRVGKNWACRICGRQFTRRFNCTTHERTHLDLKERAQFQCRLCERAFTRRHDLERHVHSVHPGHTVQRDSDGTSPLIISQSDQNIFDLSALNQAQISSLDHHHHHHHLNQTEIPRSNSDDNRFDRTSDHVRILMIEQPSGSQTDLVKSTTLMSHSPSSPSSVTATALQPSTTTMALSDQTNPPTAILTSGSIRGISQGIERVPLDQITEFNPNQEPIFKFDKKWACGTCGRIFVRRNNCKAHEATHRDIREHQCPTCSRSFSRKHDLERHMSAVHPGVELSDGEYESSDPNASRRKRRKQVAHSDEWTAIDPFILSLGDRSRSTSPTKGGPVRWEDNTGGDGEGGSSELGSARMHGRQQHHPTPPPPTRVARAASRSARGHGDENELAGSHVSARRRPIPPPPPAASHFNIFETFEPVGSSALSDSNSHASPPASLHNPLPPPTIPTSTTIRPITATELGAENLSEQVIQLDPRLFA
ncbi:uncharacterized protein PGTG_08302 [Puccinia graminis f. sp. tritici CRL 75-36-700-3]|uniref:C2H2-type domain-containing protein n=1 Tax=Puccinia graminis f. sp. tritici (strain CRL 75-36-700-3 / race SCCL) TaxID=418459 RepID=E3KDX1_PUCGT|nr:uncharacterized protein PGTG_08302 [Puccinia graminis f. sp. tritici CRL 75-36-700-3]EFP82346.1 hypothetical protein PGTG_08302 [Puccinia graminis f. sp. tritici CRL 75-36-700-3]